MGLAADRALGDRKLDPGHDGDGVGWLHEGAESKAAFRSPPAVVAACWAVVRKAAADDFAVLAACRVCAPAVTKSLAVVAAVVSAAPADTAWTASSRS